MNRKKLIRKVLFFSGWLLVLAGMTTLLVAASRKQKEHVCREILIGIKGTGEKFYIEKDEVQRMIERSFSGSLTKKPVTAFDLSRLEKMLENSAWIRNAELYFDSRDALHVLVEEREPIARVFTVEGSSFYMDSSGHRMPLLDRVSARVPVVTGFTDAKKLKAKDSALLEEVKEVAGFIYSNAFWNAQIGQIDITPERRFELIPVIGDHIIRLGAGEKVEEKLKRLFVFYKQVLSKAGFNKYAALDVQFDGQVVAIRKDQTSTVDSIQLQKNIEELMQRASLQVVEEDMLPQAAPPVSDSTIVKPAVQDNSVPVKTEAGPDKTIQARQLSSGAKPARNNNPSNPPKTQRADPDPQKRNTERPKAVMGRHNR